VYLLMGAWINALQDSVEGFVEAGWEIIEGLFNLGKRETLGELFNLVVNVEKPRERD
jgi:hypothetical protein